VVILDFPEKDITSYTVTTDNGLFLDNWTIVKQEKIEKMGEYPEIEYKQHNHSSEIKHRYVLHYSKTKKTACTVLEGTSIRPVKFVVNYGNVEKDITKKVRKKDHETYIYYKTLFERNNIFT
jgi:hypothetical protein